MDRSIDVIRFKHIVLKALHPVDIVVTKIGRLESKDMQDIETCITGFKLSKLQIKKRAAMIDYIGDETVYKANLEFVLKNCFVAHG